MEGLGRVSTSNLFRPTNKEKLARLRARRKKEKRKRTGTPQHISENRPRSKEDKEERKAPHINNGGKELWNHPEHGAICKGR